VTDRDEKDHDWLDHLYHGLVCNQSVEWLRIHVLHRDIALDVIAILVPYFENNDSLRGLEIPIITATMFKSLSQALSTCKDNKLECIYVHGEYDFGAFVNDEDEDEEATVVQYVRTYVEDEVAAQFISSLNAHCVLDLDLSNILLQSMGCTALANLLKNPASRIRGLVLGNTALDDDCIVILSNAFIENNTLRILNLGNLRVGVSATGWDALLKVLYHGMCSIEKLALGWGRIDDDIVTLLSNALVINKSVKCLSLGCNSSITSVGWIQFIKCLRSPASSLEQINLCGCDIEDEGVICILAA
jgi:hypothetical protein